MSESKRVTRTLASKKAGALVALPMCRQIPNAVIDAASPSKGAALVALPYGRSANAVIIVTESSR
jgi:hypothetical protein